MQYFLWATVGRLVSGKASSFRSLAFFGDGTPSSSGLKSLAYCCGLKCLSHIRPLEDTLSFLPHKWIHFARFTRSLGKVKRLKYLPSGLFLEHPYTLQDEGMFKVLFSWPSSLTANTLILKKCVTRNDPRWPDFSGVTSRSDPANHQWLPWCGRS